MKPIRLSGNTKEQLFYRGITEEEVIETISSSTWKPAEPGRLEAREDFVYEKDWNKKAGKANIIRLFRQSQRASLPETRVTTKRTSCLSSPRKNFWQLYKISNCLFLLQPLS